MQACLVSKALYDVIRNLQYKSEISCCICSVCIKKLTKTNFLKLSFHYISIDLFQ